MDNILKAFDKTTFLETNVFEAFCEFLIYSNTEILNYRLIMAYSQLLSNLEEKENL